MDIKTLAEQAESYIIERRRYYHSCPELTGEEKETRASIHRDLEALGITDIRDMEHCYGLIADIHGGKPGKTVALRTDIDALPVQEATGLPFASKTPGKMHACGHDSHIAILLGAAKILQEHRDELCGNVRLVVQPAEESVLGAKWMISENALEGVDAIYGAHIWGTLDAPYINIESGPRMAYMATFTITVEGMTAHGSAPHLGIDAVTCAASVISTLQQYVSRINDPLEPLVLTMGTIHGGTRFNVIPGKVVIEGTLRAYHSDKHEETMRRIIENTCAALNCKGTLEYVHGCGALINDDDDVTEIARNAVAKLYGAETLKPLTRMLGSEDFAEYAELVPAVYGFIGTRDTAKGYTATNHQEKYDLDESLLKRGSAVMAQFAADYLEAKK